MPAGNFFVALRGSAATRPPAPASGSLEHEDVAPVDLRRVHRTELLAAAIGALDPLATGRSRSSAASARRPDVPVLGYHRELQGGQEPAGVPPPVESSRKQAPPGAKPAPKKASPRRRSAARRAAPESPRSAGQQRFRVRVSQTSGSRSRSLEVRAASEEEARREAMAACGEGWKILACDRVA